MKIIENREVYYLIYDTEEFLIFGKLESGARLATGREHLEEFQTEAQLESRVDEIKGEGFYQENK